MNPVARVLKSLAGLLVLFAGMTGAAHAVDLSHAVILVASESLAGSPYAETVVLVAPLPEGGHMGFVLNRPTGVRLETLFPDQQSTRNVVEQVYAGGPVLPESLFAVTRKPPPDNGTFVPLLPGLFAVIDGASVDSLIEKSPNDARYFVGLMAWPPEALDEEVRAGAWLVLPADANTALPANSSGLWKAMKGTQA